MTRRPLLEDLELADVSVPREATFAEAARALCTCGLAAIAVVDRERRVVGMFTQDDLLGGVFGHYLDELRHTAFLEPSMDVLLDRARDVGGKPVREHMTKPVCVEARASSAHLAERFLHAESGALAVTEAGRFVGMVSQIDVCRLLVRRLDEPGR